MKGLVLLIFDQTDYKRRDIQDLIRATNTMPTQFRRTRSTNIDPISPALW